MELNTLLFLISLSVLCLYFLKLLFASCQEGKPISGLPPGPKPWPIIGNVLLLSDKPHRSLASLANIHGPLMTLKIGKLNVVVVTSVDVAGELFQKHDMSFSSRPIHDAARAADHHKYSVGWLPVSPKWRSLRKICAVHLFTKQCLDTTQLLRQQKVQELLEYVSECAASSQAVEIGRAAFTATLNLLSNTFFSIDLASHGSASSSSTQEEFEDLVLGIMEVLARPNLVDLFPVLRHFDPQGVRRDAETIFCKFLAVIDEIIRQRLSADESSSSFQSTKEDDVLATLLKIIKEGGSNLSLDDIKHLIIDLFLAGTNTTSSTIEWAMTELLRNPKKMAKAQLELDEILGKLDGLVQESNIGRLPYLQAVVKETLRLHPPGPLLLPRKALTDVDLRGYIIPRGSRLLVNIWAIGRDPNTWQDPQVFLPERFVGSKTDFKGQDFELIPFGSGRRICPGLPLAYRMMHLLLANLLYSYRWKLGNGVRDEDLDITEKVGFTLQKAKPLLAIPMAKS